MTDPGGTGGELHAQHLGLPVLAALVDGSRTAIVVLRADRSVVYGNPAACLLLGRSLVGLRGHDLLDRVPVDERPQLSPRLKPSSTDRAVTFNSTVLGADDTEHEVTGSALPVRTDGASFVALTLWDQTEPHAAMRAGAALVQTAAMVGAASVDVMLTHIAQHAVEGTRASGCHLVVVDDEDRFADRGAYWRPGSDDAHARARGSHWVETAEVAAAAWIDAITVGAILPGEAPGQPVVLPDARMTWSTDPITRSYAEATCGLSYRAALGIPLGWQNRVIGLCVLYLPSEVALLTESELAFATALADQAALAVMNGRLSAAAGETAALNERGRLARELHDSVIQALFSMTMHARAAQLALESSDVGPVVSLAGPLHELSTLTRDALAEMRALIFELRPGALAEQGLVLALRQQGTVLAARHGFTFGFDGPVERIILEDEVEEQLYRIALEALHNVAKHARATQVEIRLVAEANSVRLTVVDDGDGFDTRTMHPGHFGLSTMAERASSV
ncbi:MAG: GAF domain-containing protein, partial [Propionibacteriaceae bacterium]